MELNKTKTDFSLRTSTITNHSLAESTLEFLIVSQRGSSEGTNIKKRKTPSSSDRKLLCLRRSRVTLAEVEN